LCTTYLLRDIAAPFLDPGEGGDTAVSRALLPIPVAAAAPDEAGDVTAIGQPGAVHLEMQPLPPALAGRLRLAAGQPAALVTTRFDDLEKRRPVALTLAVFRLDRFRIVVQAAERLPVCPQWRLVAIYLANDNALLGGRWSATARRRCTPNQYCSHLTWDLNRKMTKMRY
jgi:hypothetical protein